MIILVWFSIKVIAIKEIGSIDALYEIVLHLSEKSPVAGNHNCSYLTMTSQESIFFGIIYIV
jgi:Na+/proline symporter